jgi:hypothetical protein
MTVKTEVKVSALKCNLDGNVFALISTAFMALKRAGYETLANEMSERIRKDAESPDDVLKIVKEYVMII